MGWGSTEGGHRDLRYRHFDDVDELVTFRHMRTHTRPDQPGDGPASSADNPPPPGLMAAAGGPRFHLEASMAAGPNIAGLPPSNKGLVKEESR